MQPHARHVVAVEAHSLEAEGRDGADQGLLEVPNVLLDVLAVAAQVEDGITDELTGSVIRGLSAAVGFDDLHVRVVRNVQLAFRRSPSQCDHRRMFEKHDRLGDRPLRHRTGQ